MLIPYNYRFDEVKQVFVFNTDNDVRYEIEINQVGETYFPESLSLHQICYEISLNYCESLKAKQDERICLTVIKIVKSLLLKGYILLFICDSLDKKQKGRHRLFNQWFTKYGDQFEKSDIEVEDDESLYSLSWMLNPKQHDILHIQNIFQDSINEHIVCKNNT